MHQIKFQQIVRDAEVANAILSVVRRRHLTEADIEKALTELHVPRAAYIARISVLLGL
ncbi:MAG TPA: hypothetical protein VFO30_09025 [Chthoniobacterales bacterium]|nr:hypothetical protein [Chthoniobacterales bacterium]